MMTVRNEKLFLESQGVLISSKLKNPNFFPPRFNDEIGRLEIAGPVDTIAEVENMLKQSGFVFEMGAQLGTHYTLCETVYMVVIFFSGSKRTDDGKLLGVGISHENLCALVDYLAQGKFDVVSVKTKLKALFQEIIEDEASLMLDKKRTFKTNSPLVFLDRLLENCWRGYVLG